MFILSCLEDDVKVLPVALAKPITEAITEVLEGLYIDKVISNLGLVVTLFDILAIEVGIQQLGGSIGLLNLCSAKNLVVILDCLIP